MSRTIHQHLTRIGHIQKYESNRYLTLQELSELSNRQLKKYLSKNKIGYSYQAIINHREKNQ